MPAEDPERRRHPRWAMTCPVALFGPDGELLARVRTLNVSDGGLLLGLSEDCPPIVADGKARLGVHLSLPRTTPNTFMFERFDAPAFIIRIERDGDSPSRAALRFVTSLSLDIDT